nr:MAG TPA: hypothetical protein [Caudoviricetes sp.]
MGFVNGYQEQINGWAYIVKNSKYYQIQGKKNP